MIFDLKPIIVVIGNTGWFIALTMSASLRAMRHRLDMLTPFLIGMMLVANHSPSKGLHRVPAQHLFFLMERRSSYQLIPDNQSLTTLETQATNQFQITLQTQLNNQS